MRLVKDWILYKCVLLKVYRIEAQTNWNIYCDKLEKIKIITFQMKTLKVAMLYWLSLWQTVMPFELNRTVLFDVYGFKEDSVVISLDAEKEYHQFIPTHSTGWVDYAWLV